MSKPIIVVIVFWAVLALLATLLALFPKVVAITMMIISGAAALFLGSVVVHQIAKDHFSE